MKRRGICTFHELARSVICCAAYMTMQASPIQGGLSLLPASVESRRSICGHARGTKGCLDGLYAQGEDSRWVCRFRSCLLIFGQGTMRETTRGMAR